MLVMARCSLNSEDAVLSGSSICPQDSDITTLNGLIRHLHYKIFANCVYEQGNMFTLRGPTVLSDSAETSTLSTYLLCRGKRASPILCYHSNDPNGSCFPKQTHTAALYLKERSQYPHKNLRFNTISTVTSRHMLGLV